MIKRHTNTTKSKTILDDFHVCPKKNVKSVSIIPTVNYEWEMIIEIDTALIVWSKIFKWHMNASASKMSSAWMHSIDSCVKENCGIFIDSIMCQPGMKNNTEFDKLVVV